MTAKHVVSLLAVRLDRGLCARGGFVVEPLLAMQLCYLTKY